MISNLIYILIFSPLLAAVFMQVVVGGYFMARITAILFFILFFALASFVAIGIVEEGSVTSNLSFQLTSIGLEFGVNIVIMAFLAILFLLKFNQIFQIDSALLKFSSVRKFKNYLSCQMFCIFTICGILVSNNIFNIFIFIELYLILTISISMIVKSGKMDKFFSRHIITNIAFSMVILISLSALFFYSKDSSLTTTSLKVSEGESLFIYELCFLLIILSMVFKFLPSWIFTIKNIKDFPLSLNQSYNVIFINFNLLIILSLKFYSIFLAFNFTSIALSIVTIALICYLSIKLIFVRQLRAQIIMISSCIFLLCIMALQIKNDQSITALYMYLILLNFVILVIFNIFYYLSCNSKATTISDILCIEFSDDKFLFCLTILLLTCIILLIPAPHSLTFLANYHVISSILENNNLQLIEYTNLLDPYFALSIMIFDLSLLVFCGKCLMRIFFNNRSEVGSEKSGKKDLSFNFWLLAINVLLLTFPILMFCYLDLFNGFLSRSISIFLL